MYLFRPQKALKSMLIFCIMFAISFLFITISYAQFYVIAGGGQKVGTEIKSLPYVVSNPGFYYITKNLVCPASQDGITISSNGVTIDLMGFSLLGIGGVTKSGNGIIAFYNNVTIRNGTIRNFGGTGILTSSVTEGLKINSITLISNEDGIYDRGYSTIIENCIAIDNRSTGIIAGYMALVINNTVKSNGAHGISGTAGSIIKHNTSHANVGDGIHGENSMVISDNVSHGNTGDGIEASGIIKNNICSYNWGDGIVASGSIIGNFCQGNQGYGFKVGESFVNQNTTNTNTIGATAPCINCSFVDNLFN